MNVIAIALVLCLYSGLADAAEERSILLVAPTASDNRVEPSRAAVDYWNLTLAELGVRVRLARPRVVVESSDMRALENYARRVADRVIQLPAGDHEPDAPEELTAIDADIVVLLSRQHIMSFTWPVPRVDPPRHLVVIRQPRGLDRGDPMVTRHVVAHELGHAIGLLHNDHPHTLMCGPCQPLLAESDGRGFLPLTDFERARLVSLHNGP